MAASRFLNVSEGDISQFLEENENRNTVKKKNLSRCSVVQDLSQGKKTE